MARVSFRFSKALSGEVPTENVRDGDENAAKENDLLVSQEWRQRLKLQQVLGPIIPRIVGAWLLFVAIILVLSGLDILEYHASVLVALLGSATISLVALFMKVVSYAFSDKGL